MGRLKSDFSVQDFDITLTANVAPTNFPLDGIPVSWRKISGPDSGELLQTNTLSALFRNPKVGGVYRFAFEIGLPGIPQSEATIVLPLAGAEIDGIVQADLLRADAFASKVLLKYPYFKRNDKRNLYKWFYNEGAGDYVGRPDHQSAPAVWVYNQVVKIPDPNAYGMRAVGTWKGKPIRVAKTSNFMVAYGFKKIGINPLLSWVAQNGGTPNDASATKSWDAGWDLAKGTGNYDSVVTALVADIWDDDVDEWEPQKNMKLWPNPNAADNYVLPEHYYDPDIQFLSPGFLYMETP